jgi:23S rRNA (uridine2552-2'-O)-methyltransferase
MKPSHRDYYYREAKKKGYKSRAAFKLLQMNKKFGLIRKGFAVLDLGASPGGWSQVALELGAKVVAVDIVPMSMESIVFIQGDITKEETLEKIRKVRERFDTVMCDASPKITGNWIVDHLISVDLARAAFSIARHVLKPGGNFVVKLFQGEETQKVYNEFKSCFQFKKFHSPQASRKRSAELYFIGKGFKRHRQF